MAKTKSEFSAHENLIRNGINFRSTVLDLLSLVSIWSYDIPDNICIIPYFLGRGPI